MSADSYGPEDSIDPRVRAEAGLPPVTDLPMTTARRGPSWGRDATEELSAIDALQLVAGNRIREVEIERDACAQGLLNASDKLTAATAREAALRAGITALRTEVIPLSTVAASWVSTRLGEVLAGQASDPADPAHEPERFRRSETASGLGDSQCSCAVHRDAEPLGPVYRVPAPRPSWRTRWALRKFTR